MVEMWKEALDKSQKFGILLTDLSKGFNCLVHDPLIAKLHAYGFDYLSLIYSYSTEIMQRVCVNGEYSDSKENEYGYPKDLYLDQNYTIITLMISSYLWH